MLQKFESYENKKIENMINFSDYTNVLNYFHYRYTDLLKNFLISNNVEVNERDCLIDYIVKTRVFMPKYNSSTYQISNALYNENLSEKEKCDIIKNSYKDVFKTFEIKEDYTNDE